MRRFLLPFILALILILLTRSEFFGRLGTWRSFPDSAKSFLLGSGLIILAVVGKRMLRKS